MSRAIEFRIPFRLGEVLQEHVYRQGPHEQVTFGLVGHSTRGNSTLLLLRDLIPLRESDLARVPQFVRLEQTLDKYTLAIVKINRESRIKVKLDSSLPDAQRSDAGVT